MQKCKSRVLLSLSVSTMVLLSSSPLHAQDAPQFPCDELEEAVLKEASSDQVKRISSFLPAKVKKRVDPRFPAQAAREGGEGWVRMSYVIDENGRVKNPAVEDSSGNRRFQKEAIRAIKKWKFDPALKNGEPTQQCHQAVQFDFILGGTSGARDSFRAAYRQFQVHVNENNIDEAEKILQILHNDKNFNRYESAWLANMDSLVAKMVKEDKREMTSIRRAIASGAGSEYKKNAFSDEHFGYLHQRLLILQGLNGLYGEALKTMQDINALPNAEALLNKIDKVVAGINEHLNSSRNLLIDLSLDDEGHRFHLLARNKFAFADIEGELRTVEVRCDSHYESFTVAIDHIWNIPSSWGQCQLFIKGDENTRFNLIELSNA